MKPIHISGAGLLGCFVMQTLHRAGAAFTWDDNQTIFNAWRASTGAIIPCEDRDIEFYAQGYRRWRDVAVQREELKPHLEQVETIYVTKFPPRRVTRKWKPVKFGMQNIWRETLPGWQFDVEGFIAATRARFAGKRLQAEPKTGIRLRARGVKEEVNTPTVVWGWRVPVTISPKPGCLVWGSNGLRPVIHFNDPQRAFERYYFHPLANKPTTWWAGSEAVLMSKPERNLERAEWGFKRYMATVKARFGEMLTVEADPTLLVEGWRAKPRIVHERLGLNAFCYEHDLGLFIAMPLYKSGVQCGPLYADTITSVLIQEAAR